MTREIIFRGIYEGDHYFPKMMVYGSLISYEDGSRVIAHEGQKMHWSVMPETVGQYTGVKDSYGDYIFEGDIIEDDEHYYGVVYWDKDNAMFCVDDYGALCDYNNTHINVIGNIHENPELVGKEQGE